MKQLTSLLFFSFSIIVFAFGQRFLSEPLEVEFYYPSSKNVAGAFKTYSAQVIDRAETLKKVKIIPNDIARNHLTLPSFIKVLDSADLQLYVFVGAFDLLDTKPIVKKEIITYSQGVERPEQVHYMQLKYKIPLYAHLYDCSGALIWAAKTDHEKDYYFGDKFLNKADLEKAWKKVALAEQQFLIRDEVIGQASLWMKDIQREFGIKKETETLRILYPKNKEEFSSFQKGVRMTKTIFRNLGQKRSHQEMIEWTLPVINYWKELLPKLEKQSTKLNAAGLYNLALLYYSIDQIEESTIYVNKALDTKEYRFMTNGLIDQIQEARKYFDKTGFTVRQTYTYCEAFQRIDPKQVQVDSIDIDQLLNRELAKNSTTSNTQNYGALDGLVNTFDISLNKNKVIEDGLVFLNNGKLLQGRIDGDLTRPKILKRGILFTPFEEDSQIKGKITHFKPSQLKRFVSDGKIFESHKANTFLFSTIPRTYFMEVLEEGAVKVLHLVYRKRTPMGIWIIPWYKEKVMIQISGEDRVTQVEKVNMYKLLKNAPSVLEKYKAGVYGNKPNRARLKKKTSIISLMSFGTIPSGGAYNIDIARTVIRDYNAYIYQQKNKAKTDGFKIN